MAISLVIKLLIWSVVASRCSVYANISCEYDISSLCLLDSFRQTKAMGDAEKDYDELNIRVKGANTRARRLLGR